MQWSIEDQFTKWRFPISFTEKVVAIISRPSDYDSNVGFNVLVSDSATLNYIYGTEIVLNRTAITINPTGVWSGFVAIGY